MPEIRKITERDLLARFKPGAIALAPLVVNSAILEHPIQGASPDFILELTWPGKPESLWFVVVAKTKSTPKAIEAAIVQAKHSGQMRQMHPLIQVPYLAPKSLDLLENLGVSGLDLCGNGLIQVPNQLLVRRSGEPNLYPDSRPLMNPYRGRSAMVGRLLLRTPKWPSLNDLRPGLNMAGAWLSLGQISKAVSAMADDLIAAGGKGKPITLINRAGLIDKLGTAWSPVIENRAFFRLPKGTDWAKALSSDLTLSWAVTGESSADRYVTLAQGGPRRIAVSNLPLAASLIGDRREPIPNFADVELLETTEPGYYFGTETDENGIRWASKLQTWLELNAGDARQQETARILKPLV